jgi:magnesium-transporting ATPase (P-type)
VTGTKWTNLLKPLTGHMLQGNYTSDAAQFFINLVTFWILYSYLVPISLFVTMEIVKFWQVGHELWACVAYVHG